MASFTRKDFEKLSEEQEELSSRGFESGSRSWYYDLSQETRDKFREYPREIIAQGAEDLKRYIKACGGVVIE
jgi:hypothetical protein